jgi:hypothetical protein
MCSKRLLLSRPLAAAIQAENNQSFEPYLHRMVTTPHNADLVGFLHAYPGSITGSCTLQLPRVFLKMSRMEFLRMTTILSPCFWQPETHQFSSNI